MTIEPLQTEDVLTFWLGELDAYGLALPQFVRQWWVKDPDLDVTIRQRFEPLHRALRSSRTADSSQGPRAEVAAIVVLDQFSRNMYRGTAQMFDWDVMALRRSQQLVAAAGDVDLAAHMRMFAYMPFMHSESLPQQQRGLELFEALQRSSLGPVQKEMESVVDFSRRHLEIVERFGRFPHRNALLGRDSTAQEQAFLEQPGSSF